MQKFVPGQRWVNNAELQMGLGTVISVEQRTTTILFEASGETRNYSILSAPLTRVVFARGDVIRSHDGVQITVDSIEINNDLLTYSGRDESNNFFTIAESRLDNRIQLNRPKDRLFTGQIDDNKWFALRYRTLQELNRLGQSRLAGLIGCRTDLIPHQLYIANEAGKRYAPRVLLADEVGLGKTIEAGLIIHQQLFTEQIRRILIVVPENLLHQWLVEMLRRFNLRFSIFDHERYHAMCASGDNSNPFQQEQLVLCSLDSLISDPQYFEDAVQGEWDMLVVDEAHHLQWEPGHASHEYQLIEQLATTTRGVLLLTATPEQLGKAGHYARLRILDPARFPDFDTFVEEEKAYEPVANAIESLFSNKQSNPAILATLVDMAGQDTAAVLANAQLDEKSKNHLISKLLDRHGTGRVLFRNTRSAIKGFPERQAFAWPLPAPPEYLALHAEYESTDNRTYLSPEVSWRNRETSDLRQWTQFDPRLAWLTKQLTASRPEKALVITSTRQTAVDIVEVLKLRSGIPAAVFHEGLSIIERDRAAAWFADHEQGAQVLVCSEIGSEGRNFQFAHHLILFDLPLNPDLLEQRIGRLDRIGQKNIVKIHIPYMEGTAQSLMYNWYHQGLEAFIRPCHTGGAVFDDLKNELLSALRHPVREQDELIRRTRERHASLNEALEKGRDRLLEYNSCRPGIAETLYQSAIKADRTSTLPAYMDKVFDCFGIHSEEHSKATLILTPAENMLTSFPHLPDDGLTITFSRQIALAYEDRQYLTWSHPMVTAAMDLILGSELGNTAIAAFSHPQYKPGTVLLECHYLVDTAGGQTLHSYLPPTLIRILIDARGRNHDKVLNHELIDDVLTNIDRQTAKKIVQLKQAELKQLLEKSNSMALAQTPGVISTIRDNTTTMLTGEINRLRELADINPNVRREEIEYFENRLSQTESILDAAIPRLDALRVLIST